jgi:uncharacterized membrane protein
MKIFKGAWAKRCAPKEFRLSVPAAHIVEFERENDRLLAGPGPIRLCAGLASKAGIPCGQISIGSRRVQTMNDQTRSEFEKLKRKQSQLEQDLSSLAERLKRFESQLAAESKSSFTPNLPSREAAAPAIPVAIPPVIAPLASSDLPPANSELTAPPEAADESAPSPEPPKFIKCLCQHCGGHLEFAAALVGDTLPCPHCGKITFLAMETRPPMEPPPYLPTPQVNPPITSQAPPPLATRSFEMRLGTYWLARVGIVVVLTGIVLAANHGYHKYIDKVGPAGKVSLLYLASGLLLGAGTWWQRKSSKESLKNYAQVLFAGGLAAVYFTTYAAHHIPNLRVIGSALLDGALLLGWAGFVVWIADRNKSEVLALFAVGLAYYTSVITRVGSFTLYSNLVLTLAAVFFLVRNRWAALSLASLAATYASYGFWRFFDGSGWHWASPEEGLWFGTYFLISYWVVFTAAVFLSRDSKFAGPNRAGFLTFNNVAFFTMFLLTMLQVRQGGFWKFSLIYGTVLLGLAELARRILPTEPLAKNTYLTQGLLLVTVGLISKFVGLQLALLLAAESVMLLTLGTARRSLILQTGAYVSGALAVGFGIDGLKRDDLLTLCFNTAVGAMMAFNAFWSHRLDRECKALVRAVPAYFTVLALISWLATTWYNTNPAHFPLVLAIEAAVLTLSVYLLRVREMAWFGQSYLLLAQAAWLIHFLEPSANPPWWNAAVIIGITLGLSHWWQRQKAIASHPQLIAFGQGLYALAIIGVLYVWLHPIFAAPTWLVLTSALALGITAYGVFTRAWFLAACGQLFLVISAGQFALQLWQKKPDWYFPLAPIAAIVFLSLATVKWFQRQPDSSETVRGPLLQIAVLYRWVALLMSLWWIQQYIPARERMWVSALTGLLIFLWAGWRRNSEALLFSAVFTVAAFAQFWFPLHSATTVYWPNLLAILALLGQQRAAKRLSDRHPLDRNVHGAVIIAGGMSLWLLLTRWVNQSAGGFYLTASWSLLALVLFTCGIALRERIYRWLGLGLLAVALGRIVLFDVWKLETLYRILSFMALGIVLLVLGFIYNKYQEKIREWL